MLLLFFSYTNSAKLRKPLYLEDLKDRIIQIL